ncbi:MAG TPA: hypothetical protein VKU44_05285, partial [Terriglobia bacterium]|nr:hypothetical protein [Terriglobia bacterium]
MSHAWTRRCGSPTGYQPGKDGPENAGFIHRSIPFSAGALYSTTEDLLRWEQGLFGGKLLSAASLAKMTTPFKDDYACGVHGAACTGRALTCQPAGAKMTRTRRSTCKNWRRCAREDSLCPTQTTM